MVPSSMTTASTRKVKRDAADQPADRASKQQKQAIDPRSSNEALGDYPQTEQTSIHAEKQAVANSLTSTNQEQSPFLRLPAEIRIRIYEFTLGGNEIVIETVQKPDVRTGLVNL
ncbi:hypothetical protein E8E13_005825 [Curvularia kusanoi]|uniref:Uncharacterized protein n=1 Tax=Curvularia kusanoi TaxID=90978 RepID=A0A9P4W7U8_CURKU|nr:hypothetical protein E8E13_005825 [Curvularia kusanoi]